MVICVGGQFQDEMATSKRRIDDAGLSWITDRKARLLTNASDPKQIPPGQAQSACGPEGERVRTNLGVLDYRPPH